MTFPTSPEDGDTYDAPDGKVYEYNSSELRWKIKEYSAAKIHVKPVESPAGDGSDHGKFLRWDNLIEEWVLSGGGTLDALVKGSPLAAGFGQHMFAFDASDPKDNNCWGWGLNDYGQLADGTIIPKSSPISVSNGLSFVRVMSGLDYSLGLTEDGQMWGWGNNQNRKLGTSDMTLAYSSPVSAVGDHQFSEVAAGDDHSVMLERDGTVYCCGRNIFGQIGDGTRTERSTPTAIIGGHGPFTKISVGLASFSCALDENGVVWTWGYNAYGQLGDNTETNRSSPVSVVGATVSFIDISAGGGHVTAMTATGEAWSWGDGTEGQLGNDSFFDRSTPVSVYGNHRWRKVVCGAWHVVVLDAFGKAWAWGRNNYGQLGANGPVTNNSIPVSVSGDKTFTDVSAAGDASYALDSDGVVWAWGRNSSGQLGIDAITNRSSPVSVYRLFG